MPTYERRQYAGAGAATTLNGAISSGATTIIITDATGWPDGSVGPFFVVIDRGQTTEEKVRIATRSTVSLSVGTSPGRGADGTSASAHTSGATVELCFSATEADEANQVVNKTLGAVTSKGDMLVGSSANTLSRLAVGADKTFHIADATQGTGTKWGAIPTGAISAANMFAAGVVDATALGTGAVTSAKILDGAVGTADIANGAITSALILDATILATDIADATITHTQVATANKDGAAGTPSMRTLGTAGTAACAGNDSRLTDARQPSSASITQAMFTSGYRATYEATSAPSSPAQGDLWYDTTNKILNVYSGAVWMTITPKSATVATAEATASTSYADLSTSGPAVTVLTGTAALVTLHAAAFQGTASAAQGYMGFAVSSATTLAASDANCGFIASASANLYGCIARTFKVTGLTAGSNVFTAKYKANANTWTFADRDITVVAIPT